MDQLQAAVAKFEDEAGALIQRVRDESQETDEAVRTDVERLVNETTESVDSVLTDVRTKRDEVDQLYGVITNTGTASAFRDDAEQQREAANVWRRTAVIFGVLAAVATGWAALASDESTQSLLARLALGAAAGGIAAYAARQSGRHRNREEEEARRLELDLTAFGPFIESLPEEIQQKVRQEFLKRVFVGRTGPSESAALTEESIGLMQDAFNVFLKAGRGRLPA